MRKVLLSLGTLIAMSSVTICQTTNGTASNQLPTTTANLSKVTLTYFGAAGWEITDGKTVILLDPLLSRPRYKSSTFSPAELPGDTRPVVGPTDPLISDAAVIDAHVKRADFILVHHTHFDHIMDVPYIARKTGAFVLGTESTTNVARANGVLEEKLITVKGGEDFEFGSFSLRIIPSLHGMAKKRVPSPGIVPRDIKPPMYTRELVEGGSLAYLLRFNGHQILTFGSMNYIEKELEGLRPNVVLMGAGDERHEIFDYTKRLLRVLGFPSMVIATHWDDWTLPHTASQEPRRKRKEGFVEEVMTASPKTRAIIPKHFEPIYLEPNKK